MKIVLVKINQKITIIFAILLKENFSNKIKNCLIWSHCPGPILQNFFVLINGSVIRGNQIGHFLKVLGIKVAHIII